MIVDESHTFVTGASRKDRELCESNVWYLTKLAKEGRSRGFLRCLSPRNRLPTPSPPPSGSLPGRPIVWRPDYGRRRGRPR